MINKQVRTEALPVFYGQNEFRATNVHSLQLFLQQFGRERLSLLRSVTAVSLADMMTISQGLWSGEVGKEFVRASTGSSWKQFSHKYLMRDVCRMGEKVVRIGEEHGVRRTALLLPAFGTAPGSDSSVRWITIDEYKSYMLQELKRGSSSK